jgi:predicted N-acetyltransferase YhbS
MTKPKERGSLIVLEIRKARPDELNEIINLSNYVFRVIQGHEPTMGWQFPTMFSGENTDAIYTAISDGKIVSIICTKLNEAIIYGHKISMASMGSVCTHPEYQGRGIASKLLNYTFNDLNEKKFGIVTISGNRGLYKRNKAVPQGYVNIYEVESAELPEAENSGMAFEYLTNCDSISRLSGVYAKEPIRYIRGVNEFPVLFNARPMVIPDETNKLSALAAMAGNEVLAYIIGFKQEKDKYKIVEYAGERSIIPDLIREAGRLGFFKVCFEVPDYDTSLMELLGLYSIKPNSEEETSISVRITNREELLKRLKPVFIEVYGYSSKEFEEFIRLLPEDDGECARVLFDRKYKQEILDMAVPLPWPRGLNYI